MRLRSLGPEPTCSRSVVRARKMAEPASKSVLFVCLGKRGLTEPCSGASCEWRGTLVSGREPYRSHAAAAPSTCPAPCRLFAMEHPRTHWRNSCSTPATECALQLREVTEPPGRVHCAGRELKSVRILGRPEGLSR